jgi:hypothetical protein
VAIHNGFVVLLPKDASRAIAPLGVLADLIRPWLLENSVELPPEPGEYYEGEDVILGNVLPAKYLCWLAEDFHVVHILDCPRPSIVTSSHISRSRFSRPTPKPKTIRRPPTDQDATDEPRRKCWVRDSEQGEWIAASLRAVLGTVGKARYVAEVFDCKPSTFCFCEIEVPNDK